MSSTALSFLALPLTTRILDPEDYGAFALVVAFMAFGTSLGTLGAGFAINQRWTRATSAERSDLVSVLLYLACAAGVLWSVVALGTHVLAAPHVHAVAAIDRSAILLSAIGVITTPLWLVTVEILVLEGRAKRYAVGVIAEATVRVLVTLLALYGFRSGALSLFIGYAAGMVAQSGVALAVLGPHLHRRPGRSTWSAQLLLARSFLKAQMSDTGYVFLERAALSAGQGLHNLGLYAHSQRYRELAQMGVKSVSRGVWPVTLTEALDRDSQFSRTKAAWDPLYVMLGCAGVTAAFLGEGFLRVLTNDKFTAAAPLISLWIVVTIIQNTAKPHFGVLYALIPGKRAAWLNTVSNIVAGLALLPLIWLTGPLGALLASALQAGVFRLILRVVVKRHRNVPFQDRWALAAIAATLISALLAWLGRPEPWQSVAFATAGCAALVLAGRDALRPIAGRSVRSYLRRP